MVKARFVLLDAVRRAAVERAADRPPDLLSSPPTERKAYAVDPLGKPAEHLQVPPEMEPEPPIPRGYYMTNQWPLLDVMA